MKKIVLFSYLFIHFSLFICTSAFAEPFKIGVILPFTGPAAANGIAMQNSIELAQKDNPNNFTNIKFIYEDAAYDAKQALSAFIKLKDKDAVNLFYIWGISFCKPIAPLAESSKVPVVGQCIEQTSYMNNKYLLRFMNSTDEYSKLLLSYIRDKHWKNMGIVLTEHAYIEGMFEALQKNSLPDEKFSIVDRYPTGPADMSTTVTKLKHSNFDSIGVFLTPGQIGQFYKLLSQQRITKPSFGTNYFENHDDIKLSNHGMAGAVYVHNKVEPSFIERYQNLYGNQSELAFGAMAYEFASLSGELFNDNGPILSADQIMKKLMETKVREGKATGQYKFIQTSDGDRHFSFPMAVKQIQDDDTYKLIK